MVDIDWKYKSHLNVFFVVNNFLHSYFLYASQPEVSAVRDSLSDCLSVLFVLW